jgi:hypothetical protein
LIETPSLWVEILLERTGKSILGMACVFIKLVPQRIDKTSRFALNKIGVKCTRRMPECQDANLERLEGKLIPLGTCRIFGESSNRVPVDHAQPKRNRVRQIACHRLRDGFLHCIAHAMSPYIFRFCTTEREHPYTIGQYGGST